MEVTTIDAAARLGVSVRQAQRLARSGRLQVVRTVGANMLLDDTGLTQAAHARRGRVWNSRTAWAAIDLLENGATDRLVGSQLSRLRRRLRTIDADDLIRLASRRAGLWRGSLTRRSAAQLQEDLTLSGESLLAVTGVARKFGLATTGTKRIEGYILSDQWEHLQERYGLEADAEGEILIHVTDDLPTAGIVTTALDLAEQWSVRERSAAVALLQDRLS